MPQFLKSGLDPKLWWLYHFFSLGKGRPSSRVRWSQGGTLHDPPSAWDGYLCGRRGDHSPRGGVPGVQWSSDMWRGSLGRGNPLLHTFVGCKLWRGCTPYLWAPPHRMLLSCRLQSRCPVATQHVDVAQRMRVGSSSVGFGSGVAAEWSSLPMLRQPMLGTFTTGQGAVGRGDLPGSCPRLLHEEPCAQNPSEVL